MDDWAARMIRLRRSVVVFVVVVTLGMATACGNSQGGTGGGHGTAFGGAQGAGGAGTHLGGGASFGPEFTTGGGDSHADGGGNSTPGGSSDNGPTATHNQVAFSPQFQGGGSYFAFDTVTVGQSFGRTQVVFSVSDQPLSVSMTISG